ncbi:MAG: methyltransferase domain-containing protein [Bacteroidia bacterium]|nr:methyltransferase domain-containing protein [Bacteroidia bacterium]
MGKSSVVNKYLLPLRNQVIDLVASDSTVLELGCGNGDLLLKLAPRLRSGKGLDYSRGLIHDAQQQAAAKGFDHLCFEQVELSLGYEVPDQYDYTIASLFLHVVPWDVANHLLKVMCEASSKTIVCGFSAPGTRWQRFLLWLDQRFNKHYKYFKVYQARNGVEGLLKPLKGFQWTVYDTFDPVIKIYEITRKKTS